MHFALDGRPEFAAPYELLNEPGMQQSIGLFSTTEQLQQQWEDCRHGIVPPDPSIALQIPSDGDAGLAPPGKHAASAFALWFPVQGRHGDYASRRTEMARRVIAKITRYAPGFESLIIRNTTFAPMNMERMFGAPGGDFCQGLLHPDQIGTNRPGPRGFADLPIPLEGLYLCGAGCHGGPAISFIPGYNAGYQALEDAGRRG
jgi:phytoene dehydrogenase-like protein